MGEKDRTSTALCTTTVRCGSQARAASPSCRVASDTQTTVVVTGRISRSIQTKSLRVSPLYAANDQPCTVRTRMSTRASRPASRPRTPIFEL